MGTPLVLTDQAPTVVGARGQEIVALPFDVWKAVEACDQQLRRYGMQMIIICESCHAHGDPHPVVHGDNAREGHSFTMTCHHAERRLDFTT